MTEQELKQKIDLFCKANNLEYKLKKQLFWYVLYVGNELKSKRFEINREIETADEVTADKILEICIFEQIKEKFNLKGETMAANERLTAAHFGQCYFIEKPESTVIIMQSKVLLKDADYRKLEKEFSEITGSRVLILSPTQRIKQIISES